MLIAVTMTLAGMLAYWASSYVRTSLPGLNETLTVQQCAGSDFEINPASSYNASTGTMIVILQNRANVALTITNTTFIYANGTVYTFAVGKELPAGGSIISFNISGISPGYSSYKIFTNCPNVFRP